MSSSNNGSDANKKQHFLVTHEKGKSSHFTILQLNALLKQDSNKRNKLTLTKLNTIPVPFTLISIVANKSDEDYIALNGLKDCIVMYLNENGQTKQESLQQTGVSNTAASSSSTTASTTAVTPVGNASQSTINSANPGVILLHPSLEGSNYIIKSMWLPDSQTELALVTPDFIKIYDLSINKQNPIYHFLLPIGKIRDVTFMYDKSIQKIKPAESHSNESSAEVIVFKQTRNIIIMSSCGYLYHEEMNEQTSAKNGVYYLTNTIDINLVNSGSTPVASSSSSTSGQPSSGAPATSTTGCPASGSAAQTASATSVFGHGISVYYSFKLQLLFWSYQSGKTFIGSFI